MGDRCVKRLSLSGMSSELTEYYIDVINLERDMNSTIQKMGEEIQQAREGKEYIAPDLFISTTKELVRNFGEWRDRTSELTERGQRAPSLTVTSNSLTAQCSYHSDKVAMEAGDQLTVIDTSVPNKLKVRTAKGEEGYVPALSCLLAVPDKNPTTASQRLQIQLLTAWLECLRKMKYLLLDMLLKSTHQLTDHWQESATNDDVSSTSIEKVIRRFKRVTKSADRRDKPVDYSRLHSNLTRIEREMARCDHKDSDRLVHDVHSLDTAVLSLQSYHHAFDDFRVSLEKAVIPIKLTDKWSTSASIARNGICKYIEVKVMLESVETREEVEYIRDPESSSAGSGSSRQQIKADQITSISGGTRMKFVIKSVVDPCSGKDMSLHDAIDAGIINQTTGMYINLNTGKGMSIPVAMNEGHIKVEYTTEKKLKEKTTAMGLISITTIDRDVSYELIGAIDPNTGERINVNEARDRKLLDDAAGVFQISTTGETLSVEDAVEAGWILAKYQTDTGEPVYSTKTYAVKSVVDQEKKEKIPFHEAVLRGLVDRDTASYVHNVTGEKIPVSIAIGKGFLKAERVKDGTGLNIETENRIVVNKVEQLRKGLINPANALSALRKATLAAK